MYARVVRFTDVDPDKFAAVAAQIEDSAGPPPGVPATAMKVLVDEDESTVNFILFFESEEDMKAADEAMDQMDASETPGTRASVDLCEVRFDMTA